ncbi:MAG TPA: S8 family serine peptidase [Pyrinomonadaceae bacterium]
MMKKNYALLLIGCLLALCPLQALAQESTDEARIRHSDAAVAGNYIVVFKESVPEARINAFAAQLAREHGGKIGFVYQHALRGFSVQLNEAQAEALSRNPQVEYVEEDSLVEGAAVQASPTWGLDRVDQRSLPLNNSYSYANSGAGVNVYIIDGGIRLTHQEFGGRAVFAYDNVGDGRNGVDCNGHGTHVAGIIGGKTYGVAKGVKLHSVRVLNCLNQALASKVIAGIDFVTANHSKPAIANLSFFVGNASDALDLAVRNLIAAGVTSVVAAGNLARDASLHSPARVTEAITVAATDQNDNQASFSNFGSVVDVYAPGVEITSAHSTDDAAISTRPGGTSSAAPFVVGMAARYLSGNPQATPASVEAAIKRSATVGKITNPGAGSPNRLVYRPDGKIVFSSCRDGNDWELYTMNPDGSEQTRLTYHDYSDDMWPEYSPDGTQIAFTSGRGDDLYYQVYVMNADGTNVRRVTNSRTGHSAESAWSPDGKQIAFRTNRDAGDWEIYVINVDGTNERRLTFSAGADIDPAWSPDGTKIAFPTFRHDPSNIEMYVMNADGSNQVNISNNLGAYGANNDYYPAWSSDSTRLSFVFDGGNDPRSDQIFVMNADGSGRRNISNNMAYEYNPSWSSDDERIVFQSDLDDGKGEIYVINADGTNRIRLTFNTGDGITAWTADDFYPDWQAL